MEITPRFDGVTGTFNTDSGKLVCVPMHKDATVLLCFAEQMNIPFAQIRLHSEDLYVDAMAVLSDATSLGHEIAHRWNEYQALKERERQCPTMSEAVSRSLLRGFQECADLLGLGVDASPANIVEALRQRLNQETRD